MRAGIDIAGPSCQPRRWGTMTRSELNLGAVMAALLLCGACAGPEEVAASDPGQFPDTASTGDEPDPTTPGSAGVTSSTPTASTTGNSTNPMDTTADPSDTNPDCDGCVNAQGICESGNFDTACGLAGAECTVCEAPSECAEGVCLEPPGCNPDNCDGCCRGDECIAVPNDANCGADGGECTSCEDSASCEQGSCELPCESNCDGCCTDDGECILDEDQDVDACGFLGFSCSSCDADEICSFGICASEACSQSCNDGCCDGDTCLGGLSDSACGFMGAACASCASGTGCNGVSCEPEAGVQWQVVLLDGEVADMQPDGGTWDAFGGQPDPYVVIEAFDFESEFVDNTASPVWNETASSAALTSELQGDLEITVMDSDVLLDQEMGTCTVSIPDEDFGGFSTVTCTIGGSQIWELTFQISPVQK